MVAAIQTRDPGRRSVVAEPRTPDLFASLSGEPQNESDMTTSAIDSTALLRRCVDMALAGIHREFPCHLPLILDAPTVVHRPRDLTPAFYGCYDWHSAVHSHWLLARWLSVCGPATSEDSGVSAALEASLSVDNLAAEYQFLNHSSRVGFERPYGLAWLLQLCAELRTSSHTLPNASQVVCSLWRNWRRSASVNGCLGFKRLFVRESTARPRLPYVWSSIGPAMRLIPP